MTTKLVLNPGKCHFLLLGVKENEQFDLICNNITLKHSSHENFDEHISAKQLTKDSTLSVE